MKLSELSTNDATDVLCEITPYIASIADDKKLIGVLKEKVTNGEKMSRSELIAYAIMKTSTIVPIVLKDHKEDVFGILGAINKKTTEEISKQNIIETMKQFKEMAKDKELIDFFKSWQQEGTE